MPRKELNKKELEAFALRLHEASKQRALPHSEATRKQWGNQAQIDKATLELEQKLVNRLSSAHKRIEQLEAALETVMRSAGHTEADIRAALREKKDD